MSKFIRDRRKEKPWMHTLGHKYPSAPIQPLAVSETIKQIRQEQMKVNPIPPLSGNPEQREEIIREIRQHIDEKADYPQNPKAIRKWSPLTYGMFFGKKYLLPVYRQPDYFRQDFLNFAEWAGIVFFPFADPKDEVIKTQFACTALALRYKRPQLFLEKELGEKLLDSDLPLDMMADDIKWKWPAFRVYLPKGLLCIKRENFEHSLMYFDVGHIDTQMHCVPLEYATELDLFNAKEHSDLHANIKFRDFKFGYKEAAILIAGMIEKGPNSTGLTTYGLVKPFAHYTLKYLQNITDELATDWKRDDLDNVFLNKLELLALQTLLFLSAYPLEYPAEEKAIRKPRLEGKHHIAGLYPARFVGQSQIRPQYRPHAVASAVGGEPSYRLAEHWRRGHWKRVHFGPKRGEQKLVWIHPYKAGGHEEEEKE